MLVIIIVVMFVVRNGGRCCLLHLYYKHTVARYLCMHKSIMNMKLVSVLLSSTLLAILVRGEESTQYWSVELISSVQDFTAAKAVASKHGMQLLGQVS